MRRTVARIEALLHTEVGRNATPLFSASRGGLYGAATALAALPAPRVGVLTGFFVPQADPPAAETDGPAGAALLLAGLHAAGLQCRLLTDTPCRSACLAALAGAGLSSDLLDCVDPAASLADAITAWRQAGIDRVVAIERCGRTAAGPPRNMRGLDMSAFTAPLDDLFLAGPWDTIAIGDGGNEIGLGALPQGLIAQHVEHGDSIACVTPASHLIMAGVSHWGVYGLIAALALLRADWRAALLACLDEALDRRILETLVRDGPAVDGVSLRRTATIDTLPLPVHAAKLQAIRAVVTGRAQPAVSAGW
ncbi:MAG TPA: glutamate cyclase domain-containing protein [Acetobacteraceae bacterium]|nr:glutamate cyclase domain-containing protein [Acetobacteraceae bacterium]